MHLSLIDKEVNEAFDHLILAIMTGGWVSMREGIYIHTHQSTIMGTHR